MNVSVEESTGSAPTSNDARVDEEVVSTPRGGATAPARGVVDEEVVVGAGAKAGRPLKDSTRRLLAAMDPAPDLEAEADALGAAATDKDTKPEGKDGKPKADTAAAEPHPDTARADRMTEHNRRLVAELAEARAKPAAAEPPARLKALDEIERSYFSDPLAAHQRLIALAHGTDKLDAKEVEDELEFMLEDLTSKKIGVPLTKEAETQRRSVRALAGLERDKRERKADENKPAAQADPTAAALATMTTLIDQQMVASKHAEKYPLLTALSEDFHGMKPSALLAAAINEGFATGELDRKSKDDELIEYASKHFEKQYETRFQALAAKVGKAKPDTAEKPAAATESTGKNTSPAGKAARTITNESASVAPATPPAKKSAASARPVRGDFRTDAAFREAVIKFHTTRPS